MAGLGLPDIEAWYIIETIEEKNNIGYKQFQMMASNLQRLLVWDGVGSRACFSRDITSRTNSFSRGRKWTSDSSSAANENVKNSATPRKPDLPPAGQRKVQSSV
ncbi:hypothetical protein QJS04_geneDACA024417 [Acorus gramineus]|uniref:Uncharacterized protein n=1 Tax=Acorus gramineus TaxID=55184 RepID=A0AAV9A1N6_ACOGR|nr:hypothetical protein QJS04_geneDACA024417 [Acorus gramineus]